jgi:hypothetical protein
MLTFGPRSVFQLQPARRENRAVCSGFLAKRMMGFEPTTFCMASRRSSQLSYIREGEKYSRDFTRPNRALR